MGVRRQFFAVGIASHVFVVFVLGGGLNSTVRAGQQGPFKLLHSLLDPSTVARDGGGQGFSVAVDGQFAALGCPFVDTGGDSASGVVKLYDTTSGALLDTLTNPSPSTARNFGWSVALSGPRLVVGTPSDSWESHGGIVYVYDVSSTAPATPLLTLTNLDSKFQSFFGFNVGISGTRVIAAHLEGNVHVYDLGSATPTVAMLTLTNVLSPNIEQYGISAAIWGSRVAIGAAANSFGPNDGGSVYIYDLFSATPDKALLTITNPIPGRRHDFARSLGVYSTFVVVGAPGNGFADVGTAHIYDLARPSPTVPVLTLTNSSGVVGDEYGLSVAISGTRVVIGAPGVGLVGPHVGSAFLFDLANARPDVPTLIVTNPSPENFDFFGHSVAVAGTLALVGAYGDDTAASESGGAYVYDLSGSTPAIPAATLNNPTPMMYDFFGVSVSASGRRVVVGAWQEDTGGYDAGSVFVYDLDAPTPNLPKLHLANPTSEELRVNTFGWSVGISGTRVAVGTYGGPSVYVYDLAGAAPATPVATLDSPGEGFNDRFGWSVAVSGKRVVVGAPDTSGVVPGMGRVFVYDSASPTPAVPEFTLENPTPAYLDEFGIAVAISSNRVVVGAPYDNAWAIDAGSVSVFDLSGATPTVPVVILTNPYPAQGDQFGSSVAISGTRVVVGAPNDYSGPFPAGSAFVFDVAGATPTVPVLTLEHPNPQDFILFGFSVAISGTRVVVGATGASFVTPAVGEAFVYDLASATPEVPVATLANPSPARYDLFGHSVAIDDTTIVAGAPYDDTNAQDRGAAYVFGIVSPKLLIVPAPGFATLSWTPFTGSGFVLQYTDSLANPKWVNAPSGAANPTTVPTADTARFYRLSLP